MLRVGCLILLACVSLSLGETVLSHNQTVVCYVATWAVYRPNRGKFTLDDVDPLLCTHLVYSFLGMDEKTFSIIPLDPEYDINKGGFEKAIALKQKNPKLKVTVAIGGWTEGSEKYSSMAASIESRKTFIDSAVTFLNKYNFDGLDLDWEYPANRGGKPEDKQNFVMLVKELKETFKIKDWILTAAVGAGKSIIDSAYDIPQISKYLDYIHLMAYDYHGKWDLQSGHNAPLYARADESEFHQMLNVNFSVRYYVSHGAPVEKFVLGLGLYGRTFLLNDTANPGIGAPTRKSAFAGQYTREDGFLGYNEICEKIITEKAWSLAWQEAHQAPYMFKDNMWVSFDDINSLGIKVAFAQRLGLAGVMVWSMDTDDFSGQCGSRYPLLNSINQNLMIHADNRFKEKVAPAIPTIRPTVPDMEDGLDKDKPHKTDIDFDTDNNFEDDSRYYPADKIKSSAVSHGFSVSLVLSLAISSLLSRS